MLDFMRAITPECQSVMLAMFIAIVRIAYDKKVSSAKRIFLEAVLCGTLTYGINSGLTYFSWPDGVSIFVGAMVGFLGVDLLREFARKYVSKAGK